MTYIWCRNFSIINPWLEYRFLPAKAFCANSWSHRLPFQMEWESSKATIQRSVLGKQLWERVQLLGCLAWRKWLWGNCLQLFLTDFREITQEDSRGLFYKKRRKERRKRKKEAREEDRKKEDKGNSVQIARERFGENGIELYRNCKDVLLWALR